MVKDILGHVSEIKSKSYATYKYCDAKTRTGESGYGSCSADCGGGKRTKTVKSTFGSGFTCNSYEENCNTEACFDGPSLCAEDGTDLFGTMINSPSGNYGSKYTDLGGSGWPSDWCENGSGCNTNVVYARKCIKSLCSTYGVYGLTAEEINIKIWNSGHQHGKNSKTNCFARYWCSCSKTSGGFFDDAKYWNGEKWS